MKFTEAAERVRTEGEPQTSDGVVHPKVALVVQEPELRIRHSEVHGSAGPLIEERRTELLVP
jgi:hypothetical protein